MKMRSLKAAAGVAVAAAATAVTLASPASATSASSDWRLAGGDTFQLNGWHCGTYVTACSWTASTKLLGYNPANARWIENKTELEAHGISASLTISKNPEATLTMVSSSLGVVRWRNYNAWISDNSGVMRPGWTTVYVSVRSCGSASVNANITVSQKCVYAGAA